MYRNCTVHFKRDGRALPQNKEILRKVNSLFHTNEDMLLPADQDPLHIDATKLGKGPAIVQDRWIANMNSAISAGRLHRARQYLESDSLAYAGAEVYKPNHNQ
eukprot:scaffold14311_cov150-Skeletonema_dohrnii-CCMP3373.AAC.2